MYQGDISPPAPYQREAARLIVTNDVYALTMEMGTGKGRPLLRAWLARDNKSIAQGFPHIDMLLIAPKGCYLNFLSFPPPPGLEAELGELEKWLKPDEYESTSKMWWGPTSKSHERELQALLVATRRRFLTMNVEALNRPGRARDYLLEYVKNRRVMAVIDESTCIMHHDSNRTEWINKILRPRLRHRYIMTGLVAPESPHNLFSQYYFLNPNILGDHFFSFRSRYAITQKVNFTPMKERTAEKPGRVATIVVGYRTGAMERLRERCAPYTYRVLLDDVADLPRSYSYWDVDLTDQQHTLYEAMKLDATAVLSREKNVTASMAAHQLALLHHIVCGHVRAEDKSLVDIPSNRVESLMELIQDHSGKAIFFAPYPRLLEKITDALKTAYGDQSVVTYWGATKDKERADARTRIQRDPETRFIVANQSVGGKGGTWTQARLTIFAANSWDQEDRQQSEFRNRRLGQTEHVHFVDMRARSTIEDRLISVLKSKRSMSAELQGDRWREWLK
jgi:hypothetical protein